MLAVFALATANAAIRTAKLQSVSFYWVGVAKTVFEIVRNKYDERVCRRYLHIVHQCYVVCPVCQPVLLIRPVCIPAQGCTLRRATMPLQWLWIVWLLSLWFVIVLYSRGRCGHYCRNAGTRVPAAMRGRQRGFLAQGCQAYNHRHGHRGRWAGKMQL